MSNHHGLDARYFRSKLHILIRDADHYTPAEMARALARLAKTAEEAVLGEPEFSMSPVKAATDADEPGCETCKHDGEDRRQQRDENPRPIPAQPSAPVADDVVSELVDYLTHIGFSLDEAEEQCVRTILAASQSKNSP